MKVKIKQYRKLLNISQSELAKRLGISNGYLCELERNKKSPTLRMLKRIADTLNVCPKVLIETPTNFYKLHIKDNTKRGD